MPRMNIDKNNYDDEETLCSEKVRDELIQLFISNFFIDKLVNRI